MKEDIRTYEDKKEQGASVEILLDLGGGKS
jgi:hypothetical protein